MAPYGLFLRISLVMYSMKCLSDKMLVFLSYFNANREEPKYALKT